MVSKSYQIAISATAVWDILSLIHGPFLCPHVQIHSKATGCDLQAVEVITRIRISSPDLMGLNVDGELKYSRSCCYKSKDKCFAIDRYQDQVKNATVRA